MKLKYLWDTWMTDSMDHGHSGKAEELIHCKDSCLKLCYVQWDVTGQLVNQSVGQSVSVWWHHVSSETLQVSWSISQSVSVWWHHVSSETLQVSWSINQSVSRSVCDDISCKLLVPSSRYNRQGTTIISHKCTKHRIRHCLYNNNASPCLHSDDWLDNELAKADVRSTIKSSDFIRQFLSSNKIYDVTMEIWWFFSGLIFTA